MLARLDDHTKEPACFEMQIKRMHTDLTAPAGCGCSLIQTTIVRRRVLFSEPRAGQNGKHHCMQIHHGTQFSVLTRPFVAGFGHGELES